MSKSVYSGGTRRRNARETYLDQISNGRGLTTYSDKKRKNFSHLRSLDDADLAYRSTSNYLRQMRHDPLDVEPMEMMLAKNLPRTKSASEMTPRATRPASGNPMYKAQEDYFDEVQTLKKELKAMREENSALRSKNRRLEEDVVRKKKELDSLGDPTKDNDLRRALSGGNTDRNNLNQTQVTNVVMSLKQRIFKLQSQVKEKENRIDEMESDPRWTRSTELEIQNRALLGEVDRNKIERLNLIQNDYSAALDEEKKLAVIKLDGERKELRKENESLKKKLDELENSAKKTVKSDDEQIENLKEQMEKIRRDADKYREQNLELKENLRDGERQRNEFQKKLDDSERDRDELQKKVEELKRENARLIELNAKKSPSPTPISRPAVRKVSSDSETETPIVITPRPLEPRKSEPKIEKIPSRPSSPDKSEDSALRTIQSALRGLISRTQPEKAPQEKSPMVRPRVGSPKDKPPQIEMDDEKKLGPTARFEPLKTDPSTLREFARSTGSKSVSKTPIPEINPDLKRSMQRTLSTSSNQSKSDGKPNGRLSDHDRSFSPSSKRPNSSAVKTPPGKTPEQSHDDDDDVV